MGVASVVVRYAALGQLGEGGLEGDGNSRQLSAGPVLGAEQRLGCRLY